MNTEQNRRYYPPDTDLSFQPVSEAEERRLFAAARAGDDAAREKIVSNHLLFAANEARKLVRGRMDDNEVVSAANRALMKALDKFDVSRGVWFSSYLRPFIRGEISALWRDTLKHSVNAEKGEGDIGAAEEAVTQPDVYDSDYNEFLRDALAQCQDELDDREKRILTDVYENERTFAEIARTMKLSREWVRVCHNAALAKLKKALKKKGITSSQ